MKNMPKRSTFHEKCYFGKQKIVWKAFKMSYTFLFQIILKILIKNSLLYRFVSVEVFYLDVISYQIYVFVLFPPYFLEVRPKRIYLKRL